MRRTLFFFLLLAVGCAGPTPGATGLTPGVFGAPLSGTLAVHVQAEDDGHAIAGATVSLENGASATTDANGDAQLAVAGAIDTLRVAAAGFTSERWIGVDHERAVVALAAPLALREVHGTISGGSANATVSLRTELSMLRTTSPLGSFGACAGGACDVSLQVQTRAVDLDVVLVDASAARVAEHVTIDGAGAFAIDQSTLSSSQSLVTLTATLPPLPAGLQAVVGVPGLSTADGVTLFPALDGSAMGTSAPAPTGALADARLWYVAVATTTDGSGLSVGLDRAVGAGGHATLPTELLALPGATRTSDGISLFVGLDADLYVIETEDERVLLLRQPDAHIDIPITGSGHVAVRAIDTTLGSDEIDLDQAELLTTRFSTLTL